jgi:hypothetical protein
MMLSWHRPICKLSRRIGVERFFESITKPAASNSSVHETVQTVCIEHSVKGLILAQNERWRRGLGMQVERMPIG